ncbi:MAG: DNA-3-methyladenine glycosylase [Chlorobi bacterium]|nr:MAG: 3-methyladenine DNA glycosylase [Chlorobi bacterium OLB7]MBK8910355.1 DNA-3-methyladenine glycosylase [Chlorobiota bacterium]MBX7217241.1 DNA-3-methyladenine glycosylase [Candidatus Kapabacteria bacterium]
MLKLPRAFFQRDARVVARQLLGHRLVTVIDGVRTSGRIIETEAYVGQVDAASHCYRGKTPRNQAMFLDGGHAYVYFIYGVHHCFNVVTGEAEVGQGVLVRGVEPVEGIEVMRQRRNQRAGTSASVANANLANGPGKLTIALGIGPEHNGIDLLNNPHIWIERDRPLADHEVSATPRIGINKATELEWRWVRK